MFSEGVVMVIQQIMARFAPIFCGTWLTRNDVERDIFINSLWNKLQPCNEWNKYQFVWYCIKNENMLRSFHYMQSIFKPNFLRRFMFLV